MRISHIHIENFRNFHKLDIPVGRSAVILGENQIGKTNLLYALRLVLTHPSRTVPASSERKTSGMALLVH